MSWPGSPAVVRLSPGTGGRSAVPRSSAGCCRWSSAVAAPVGEPGRDLSAVRSRVRCGGSAAGGSVARCRGGSPAGRSMAGGGGTSAVRSGTRCCGGSFAARWAVRCGGSAAVGSPVRRRGAAVGRSTTRGAHTSVPRGVPGRSSAVSTRSVSRIAPPSFGSFSGSGTAAVSPGRRSGSAAGAVRVRPSARVSSQVAVSPASPRTRCWLVTTMPSCRWHRMRTAAASPRTGSAWSRPSARVSRGPGPTGPAAAPSLTHRTIPRARDPRMKPP